jgi:hypothetical protein
MDGILGHPFNWFLLAPVAPLLHRQLPHRRRGDALGADVAFGEVFGGHWSGLEPPGWNEAVESLSRRTLSEGHRRSSGVEIVEVFIRLSRLLDHKSICPK